MRLPPAMGGWGNDNFPPLGRQTARADKTCEALSMTAAVAAEPGKRGKKDKRKPKGNGSDKPAALATGAADETKAKPAAAKDKPAKKAKSPKGGDKGKISFRSVLPRDEAAAYFDALLSGLRKGTLNFKQSDAQLELNLPVQLNVEVKAERKGAKEKVTFELSWREPDEPDLKIS